MGGALVIVGVVLMIVGGIMLLWAAFKESLLWGIGSIVVPLVALIFVATHWSEAKMGFLIQLLGVILFVAGGAMTPDAAVEEALAFVARGILA